jgi:hypothetical protein
MAGFAEFAHGRPLLGYVSLGFWVADHGETIMASALDMTSQDIPRAAINPEAQRRSLRGRCSHCR